MKLIPLCAVFALQSCFSVITGLTKGPGVCKDVEGKLRCCGDYVEKDGSCILFKPLNGKGFCKDIGGNVRCCTNFQFKDGHCQPCEVGTFGVDCSGGQCPYGSYGFGCQSKCNCNGDQYCDRRIGCTHNATKDSDISGRKQRSVVSTVVAVVMAVILSVGSFLVVIVILYNERIKVLTSFRTNHIENNNISRESEETQEDYSQMTRTSSNYNMLNFNRIYNVVSKVNETDEEDIYDHGESVVPNQTAEVQDGNVALPLRENQVMLSTNALNNGNVNDKEKYVAARTHGGLRECYSLVSKSESET